MYSKILSSDSRHYRIAIQLSLEGHSGSSARESVCLFPQPLHVAHRWDAKEAFVLAVEVGGVVIPHAIGGTCRVEVFAQHQTAGLLEPQPLLELQGAHRRDGLLRGGANPRRSCPALARVSRCEVAGRSLDGVDRLLWRCG